MKQGDPAKFIASTFGLAAFAIAVVAGLAAQNPADRVLGRALICLVICQIVGWVLGSIGARAVDEAVETNATELAEAPEEAPVLAEDDSEILTV